jgi:succinoglycan biosynthesis transport protein ExoP
LEEQENQLRAFRVSHSGETPDDLNGNLQAISTLQAQLQANVDAAGRLDEERILLTQAPRQAESRDAGEQSERSRLLQDRARLEGELSNLRREYTESYPDVISARQQLNALNTRIASLPAPAAGSAPPLDAQTRVRLELVTQELARRNEQQIALRRKMASYQGKVESVPALQMQLAELTRNYEVSKQNYQSLLDKSISAGMAKDLESNQEAERFTALDKAKTPEKPFSPKRIPMIVAVSLISLILPCAAILGLEFVARRVETESDIQEMLTPKLEILGKIPKIVSDADRRRTRFVWLGTGAFSVASGLTLALVLLKVKPIL